MGRLAVLTTVAVAAAAQPAGAKRVIMDPPLVRKCPSGVKWSDITSCLGKSGTVQVLRARGNAKLVQIVTRPDRRMESGVVLYVFRRGRWTLGGHWQSFDSKYTVLGFEPVKAGKHTGWRIDLGQSIAMQLVVDDISPMPATQRIRRSLYCSGQGYYCADVITSCEIIARGTPRFVFHGTAKVENNMVSIRGDRSRAGRQCTTPASVYLGWADG